MLKTAISVISVDPPAYPSWKVDSVDSMVGWIGRWYRWKFAEKE